MKPQYQGVISPNYLQMFDAAIMHAEWRRMSQHKNIRSLIYMPLSNMMGGAATIESATINSINESLATEFIM